MGRIIGLQFPKQEPQKFTCPVCGEAFAKRADLTKHMKEQHPENPKPEDQKQEPQT